MTAALACLLAWSAGVAMAAVVMPGNPGAGAAALIGAVLAAPAALAVRPAVIALAVAAALLGVARAEVPAGDPTAAGRAPALAGLQAVVEGRLADDPRLLAGAEELLVVPGTLATSSGQVAPAGSVVAFVKGAPAVGIDDLVQVTGRLDLPRDTPTFDRRAYTAQKGAYLEIRSASLTVVSRAGGLRAFPGWLRDRYRTAITSLIPPPHADVLVGVVLGIRTGIPRQLQQDLVATGLVHLLVLSGLKVALFARLVTGVLSPALGRSAALPAVALIVLYALAGGATPAATRAAAMGGLALIAARLGRPTHLWTSLAATAAAMLAWHPELAWDVGFQLSFFGTAAIVLLTPAIERRLEWLPGWVREPFAVTLAAQVGTVPLMATDFRVLSPVAPIANAVVLPLLPVMVGAGLLVAPLAALPAVGRVVALPLTGLLVYLEQVASLLARAPAAAVSVPAFPPGSGVAYYAALGGAIAAARTRGSLRRAALAAGVLVPLAVGGAELAAWARPAAAATVLAVGQGQAVLLSGPDGYVLVDGGASPSKLADELGAHLPPWQRSLAALVITGPGQAAHLPAAGPGDHRARQRASGRPGRADLRGGHRARARGQPGRLGVAFRRPRRGRSRRPDRDRARRAELALGRPPPRRAGPGARRPGARAGGAARQRSGWRQLLRHRRPGPRRPVPRGDPPHGRLRRLAPAQRRSQRAGARPRRGGAASSAHCVGPGPRAARPRPAARDAGPHQRGGRHRDSSIGMPTRYPAPVPAARPILLLHGEESFLVDDEARRTLAEWHEGLVSEFGFEALDPSSLTAGKLRDAVLQAPFLDPYRVVTVRGLAPRRADGIAPALADVPESTRLLVTVNGRVGAASKLVKAIAAAGGRSQEHQPLKARALSTWIFNRTKHYRLPTAAGATLVRLARPDLGVIDSELRKLAAYQDSGNPLDQAAIDELVVAGRQDEVFRLTDHLLPRPDAEAWSVLAGLLERDQPTTIAYRLARHLSLVLDVKARQDRGETLSEVQSQLREHAFVVQKAYDAAVGVSADRLESGLRALLAYEWEVKSGQIDASPGLEAVLAKL
jgi:competence protein ComEC